MNKVTIGILLLLLATACAEEKSFDSTAFEQGAFARWMEKYHPTVPRLTGNEAGIYAEWFDQNPAETHLREGYWLEMDYTLRDQNGDIFYTRSPRDARLLFGARFDRRIRYVPERMHYAPATMVYTYPSGLIRMLGKMAEGDSARFYMGPEWGFSMAGFGYSAEDHFGYAREDARVSASMGLIVDMRLNRVIKDIDLYEREQVTRWAADSLGITDPADSIALGVYFKKTIENPTGEEIESTSTARVYYTTRFLDGHVLDTNIDSVARAHHITAKGGLWEVTSKGDAVDAAKAAVLKMRVGERARFVTISDGAYGSEGSTDINDGHVIVPPYTPLEFEFYIESIKIEE